jgi:hypothetical protein
MARRALAPFVCAVAAIATLGAARGSQDVTSTSLLAIERWVAAVDQHAPGRMDAAVRTVWTLSPAARLELIPGMELFLKALTGKATVIESTPPKKRIVEIALDRARTGANRFLERAAVLHADAAMSSAHAPAQPAEKAIRPPHPGGHPSPFFPEGDLILDTDGEVIGNTGRNWNWTFARSLLDLVAPRPAEDPFVEVWYHATTANMLGNGQYGEATAHLQHAAALLPEDARLLFDRACLAEFNGLSVSQELLTDEDLSAMRLRRNPNGVRSANGPRVSSVAAQTGIPPAEVANAEAEHLFRRALSVDPALAEARVRLARLLDLRGHHQEADAELTAALAASRDPVVTFYAHLFAGRANRELDRGQAAASHYHEALVLFPDAQSALLGASQTALLGGDVSTALAHVRRLGEAGSRTDAITDPWWMYRVGAGRNTNALLEEMWAAALR